MRAIRFGAGCELRLLEESDADELHALVEDNRAYLSRWMPWAPRQDFADTLQFIRLSRRQSAHNNGLQAGIVREGAIIGIAGFHAIDWNNRSSSIGYWLAEDEQGRGTMTAAVAALCRHAFTVWELNRVEIRIAPANLRSRAVAERLGFVYEGTLRDAEILNGKPHDLLLHSLLAREWRSRPRERRGAGRRAPAG